MLALKKIANGFGIILSTLLSIVLLVVLLAAPIVNAVCSFTEAKTIHKIIKDIDFVELVARHEELRDTLEKYGIDGQFLDGITETELVEQLVQAYIESLFEGKLFDPQVAEDIILAHKDEAISLFRRLAEEQGKNTADITDDEFFASILNAVHTEWEKIMSALPLAEDLGLTQEEYDEWAENHGWNTKTLNAPARLSESMTSADDASEGEIPPGRIILYLRTGAPVRAVILAAAVLSVLILLLRWPRFQGFMWLAVDYLLAAVLLFACTGGVSSQGVQRMIPTEELLDLLLIPVISVFTDQMNRYGVILAVLGIVFIAVFVLGRLLLRTLKQRHEEQPATCIAQRNEIAEE